MKHSYSHYVLRASVVAVQGALAALAMAQVAAAEEVSDEIRELTQRSSYVEAGVGYVDKNSFKFGEYNGLQDKGVYGIGGFELNGGEQDSAFRWQVRGADLGLETRSFGAEVGVQGRYRLNYSYDELRRNASDNYSTPFQGAGSRSLTLPASIASANRNGNAGLNNWNNIQTPGAPVGSGPAFLIPPAMQQFDVDTKRVRHDLGLNWILGSNWDFKTSVRHEDKTGTKLTGVSEGFGAGMILPEPINSSTDQLNASLAYKTEHGHFVAGYYGSIYTNNVDAWTAQNPFSTNAAGPNLINGRAMLSGAPDNQMHQLNLAGAYNFSKVTRLMVSGSYARMTQNENFHYQTGAGIWSVPESSAHAKVINTNFNARLTTQATKDVTLNAAYKYEDRDNRTPVATFRTAAFDSNGATTLFTTEPLNRRLQQINLDADYRFARGQGIKGGYEWQEIKRTSDSEETPFRAEKTREQTLKVEYRNSLLENVNGRVAYAYSQRRSSEYEPGNPAPTDPAAPLPAADPLLPDFKQFYLADRNRDKLRTSVDYQATNALSFQAGVDYNRDNFNNSPNGLQETTSWVFNLDGAYAATETLSFNAYYTYEDLKSRLDSHAIPRVKSNTVLFAHTACTPYALAGGQPVDYMTDPCRNWSETQSDHVHTVGFGAKAKDLMAGKLDLTGNVAYSYARTPISVSGGTYYSNGLQNVFIPAQSLPDISSKVLDFRLVGKYTLDKTSAVRVGYQYRRLSSSDFQYDAFSNVLAMQGYIGTGQTSPNYAVQVLGVSYIYTFR